MRILEPHIHMYSRTTDDYEELALAGAEMLVEPSFWLGSDRSCPETFYDYFNHMLEFEPTRAAKFGITHYTCIGVNPKEANNLELALQVVEGLTPYLDHPRCLAVGEIGLDKNTEAEVEVLRQQIRIGITKSLPILVHTPHQNKKAGTERIVEVLKEEEANPEMVLIDHNTPETIEITLEYGSWAGMTIYPGKITAEEAIGVLQKYGISKMMINSSADWGISDPLSVPRTCRKMREVGFTQAEINQVVWQNPYDFYALSEKLPGCWQ